MIAAAAQSEYAHLLSESLPTVIDSEGVNELYLEQVSTLLRREGSLSPAERQLLTLLMKTMKKCTMSCPRPRR